MKKSKSLEISDERKTKILDEATKLFCENGYKSTTMKQISEICGFESPNLYNYYRNKEEILFNVVKADIKLSSSTFKSIADDKNKTATEKIKNLIRSHFDIYRRFGKPNILVIDTSLRKITPTHRKVIRKLIDETTKAVEKIIQEGVNTGEFRKIDVQIAGLTLLSMLMRSRLWFSSEGRLSTQEFSDEISDIFCQGIENR